MTRLFSKNSSDATDSGREKENEIQSILLNTSWNCEELIEMLEDFSNYSDIKPELNTLLSHHHRSR